MFLKSAATRLAALVPVILLTALLSSCLDIDTTLELNRRGEMTAKITYILDGRVADYGRGFGADDPWPFPLTERDFRLKAQMNDGVRLKRYKTGIEQDGSETVTALIKADSVRAMSAYLGLNIEVASDGQSGSLSIRLPGEGEYAEASPETREAVDRLAAASTMRFSVRPPSRPVEAEAGTINGRTVDFEVPLLDILYGKAPDELKVSW